ncbi:hypothetical protein HJG60_011990 [Phyllostomus discolor]|uniref:Uncharacterized protein n=1 Tax=Phyllostomus discolor TaxID=89673 RepID=A0A834DYJ5_9CHIR|nr:hypothetical protein HJG60_011990 [Phyllostomus discolor]
MFMCVHAHEYMKDWICTSVYMHVHGSVHVCVCVHVHVCACPCARVYVYVYCKDEVLGCCSPFWLLTLPTDHGVLPHFWPPLAEKISLWSGPAPEAGEDLPRPHLPGGQRHLGDCKMLPVSEGAGKRPPEVPEHLAFLQLPGKTHGMRKRRACRV